MNIWHVKWKETEPSLFNKLLEKSSDMSSPNRSLTGDLPNAWDGCSLTKLRKTRSE